MRTTELLVDAFDRIRDAVHPAVNGLTLEELAYRPDRRVQLDRLADLAPHPDPGRPRRRAGAACLRCGWRPGWAEPVRAARSTCRHRLRPRARCRRGRHRPMPPRSSGTSRTCTTPRSDTWGPRRRRPRPGGRPPLGPAGDSRRPAGQCLADDLQHVGQASYVRGILPDLWTTGERAIPAAAPGIQVHLPIAPTDIGRESVAERDEGTMPEEAGCQEHDGSGPAT